MVDLPAAQGSILIAALFHFQMNGPAWPDAQPWENYLFALVAAGVVLINRKAMLTRDGSDLKSVTEVVNATRQPSSDSRVVSPLLFDT